LCADSRQPARSRFSGIQELVERRLDEAGYDVVPAVKDHATPKVMPKFVVGDVSDPGNGRYDRGAADSLLNPNEVFATIFCAKARAEISHADGRPRGATRSKPFHVQPDSYRGANTMNDKSVATRRTAKLDTPTSLGAKATRDLSGALNALVADFFALYLKTKNFHWHVSGPHFRDYHLLLDEQADQLYATTDPIAERVRKLGGTTLRSIGHIGRLQRVLDNDAEYVTPLDMLAELREDNARLADRMRETHGVCDEHGDVATASLLEVWIDEAERRAWFLFEATRVGEAPGR